MAMTGEVAYALAKTYVDQTLQGGAAVAGKNVTISSIDPIYNKDKVVGNRITFSYTLDSGAEKTDTLDVMDGEDGEDGIDGFSPIITEDPNNTDNDYRLDITDIDGSFTTPNLKGKDGINGLDGFSPTIDPNLYNDSKTYKLDITDINGTYTTDNLKGEKGDNGTTDYNELENKPKINDVALEGSKTLDDLGIQPKGEYLTEVPEEYVTQSEMEEYAQPIGDYSLVSNTGYDLGLSIDPITYVMYLELKNAAGVALSTKMIDFPLESMVIGATYSDGQLTLRLQNGQTLPPIDISDIVGGLVSDTFTIAGIDMKDNITKEELAAALGVPTKISELENDEKFIKESDLEMENIDFSSYFIG